MRLLALAFLLLVSGVQMKAQVLADFETPPYTPTISSQTGSAAGVRDNPDLEGNPSTNVAYYKKAAGNWRAVYLIFPTQKNVGKNNQLVFKIRSSTQGRVFVKVLNGNTTIHENWAPDYSTQPLPNKWTQCVLNITTIQDQPFTRIEVNASVDNDAEADVYLDDFRLVNSASPDGEPIIQLSVSTYDVPLGQSISFDALGSIAQSGSIVSYSWILGMATVQAVPRPTIPTRAAVYSMLP